MAENQEPMLSGVMPPVQAPANEFLVGAMGETVTLLLPRRNMTREEAIGLAAWLVAMAGSDIQSFAPILEAVMNT